MCASSSFLSGGKQDLNCTGRTRTGRVDQARAMEEEAVMWGNKDVGQRLPGAGWNRPGGDLQRGATGVALGRQSTATWWRVWGVGV